MTYKGVETPSPNITAGFKNAPAPSRVAIANPINSEPPTTIPFNDLFTFPCTTADIPNENINIPKNSPKIAELSDENLTLLVISRNLVK